MSETTLNRIKKALKIFKVKGTVQLNVIGDIVEVIVNNKYFGIWDCNKNTFVD